MVHRSAAAVLVALCSLAPSALGNQTVLLSFSSPECPPCRQMAPIVHGLAGAGHPIRSIDVTREPQLATQHGVTHLPCFVMLAGGVEVDRMVGATTGARLEQMFQLAQQRDLADRDQVRAQSPDPYPPTRPQDHPWIGVGNAEARAPQGTGSGVSSLDARLLSASVRLRVEDSQGHGNGSGTIIDARSGEALIVTCGHVFRESQGAGPLTVELFEATPHGVRPAGQVTGQVISYDLDRDVGLVSIRPGRPVCVAPVAPPQTAMERGDRVSAVGCSQGQDPTVLATRITSIDRYQGPPNIQAAGAPIEGRSGGGLFNEAGQLIGVCFAADHEGNEGLYAGLESVHGELEKIGLGEIYLAAADNVGPSQAIEPPNAVPVPPVVRGQAPLTPITPVADRTETMPAGLNAVEQAAWEEIMSRAASSEVICIIRPKESGAASEVITLDDVSPEFVRALLTRRRDSQGTAVP